MLTPVEIQNTRFKSAASGYNKSQVDSFMEQLNKDYEYLYRQNIELNEKIDALNDRVQYYTTIEKSLHKALVLAENSAEETKAAAAKEARALKSRLLPMPSPFAIMLRRSCQSFIHRHFVLLSSTRPIALRFSVLSILKRNCLTARYFRLI